MEKKDLIYITLISLGIMFVGLYIGNAGYNQGKAECNGQTKELKWQNK